MRKNRIGAATSMAVLFLLLAFSIISAAEEVLPPSGFEGWKLDGKARTYPGEALYNHIDGGAEPFLELGFETCEVRRYSKEKLELTAECYRMSDASAALGIYLMQCGRETPDPALAERHTAGENQVTVVKGRHLIRLTGRPGACPKREVFIGFARWAAGRIPGTPPPAILSRAPSEGAVEGSLRIIRGPVTLQALAPPFPAEAVPFGREITGVASDQHREGRLFTVLLVEYPDPAAASAAAASLGALESKNPTRNPTLEFRSEGPILRVSWPLVGDGPPAGK